MSGYKGLLETVAKREMGIIGKTKTHDVFREVGIPLTEQGDVEGEEDYTVDHLEQTLRHLHEKFGPVAVMGCKIAVSRQAKDEGLELPPCLIKRSA